MLIHVWHCLARIAIHTKMRTMCLACILVCVVIYIGRVFAHNRIQYISNTNTTHTNTDWYVLNKYLFVLNT